MSNVKESLKLLFDRPSEPLITPKGDDNKLFQLSDQFLTPEYESIGLGLNDRYGEDDSVTKIPLMNLPQTPDLSLAMQLPKDADFSLFIPRHRDMATQLINAMMAVPENQLEQYLSTCAYARTRINPQLFNYCYSVSLLHRKDTRDVPIQNFAEAFPSKFLDSKVFGQARETAELVNSRQTTNATTLTRQRRAPIVIPRDYTATDRDLEHRVAYWREDIGVNLHHWHWHLVYPFSGDVSIVNKDRRGELFFYMHQQIIARFNVERLCNQLPLVKKFNNWSEPIPEAYYPKLDNLTTARGWPPRQANMQWRDVNRPIDNLNYNINQMMTWRRNIEDAIATGMVRMANGQSQPLTIDILGNMVEASVLSPNREFYGDLHNSGHVLTGYIHDPDHRYLENFAVIADEATTMRDPFFFRWHAFIDDLFQSFKQSAAVRPYSQSELTNPGVQVTGVQVTPVGGRGQANVINTFWMRSDVDLSRGLDFSNRGPVYARYTHLNHRAFTYNISVNNTGSARRGTVRIFIAPKTNESGRPWNLNDQRKMFIELDRFVTPLSAGMNNITRQSSQSSVTIPFEQTFRDLSPQGDNPRGQPGFNWCGCGWPQHMLVPKGTEGGYAMELFVMVSNWEQDRVDQPDGTMMSCDDASSFCGLQDKLFPDRRSMGFPFDRPSNIASSIQDFIAPNMALVDVTIRHQNMTEDNPKNPPQ